MQKELHVLGRVSEDVFEQHTSTKSGLFEFFGTNFAQIFDQIVPIRVKTLSNINLVVPRHIKVHRSKTSFPKNLYILTFLSLKFLGQN